MHVVIACYHHFDSNSGGQAACLANALASRGVDVTVFVPSHPETARLHGPVLFKPRAFPALESWLEEEKPAARETVLLAWTPREVVRKFTARLRARLAVDYFVHLEDNELLLTATHLGLDVATLAALPPDEIGRRLAVDERLTHPLHFPGFIAAASGITVLIDRLAELAPPTLPRLVFWPGYNPAFFRPQEPDLPRRRALGIGDDVTVLTYPGNVHAMNVEEVRSLYLATCLLNRRGSKALLLRTGEDYVPVLDHTMHEAGRHFLSLGKLSGQAEVAAALAAADFLVQPGRAGDFNDYRFPSKLPEFFITGRPVLLPATNLGRFVHDGRDAVVLRRGDAFEVASQIAALQGDAARREMLAANAVRFAREHFDWSRIAARVREFLQQNRRTNAAAT